MGNTFAERSADIDKIYYRDHLNFVLDNWYVLQIAFGTSILDVKYIIAALSIHEEKDEELI